MPLANTRDKWTQIVWGIADFKRRFGRKPESMWLPETAVDLETLDLLAEAGPKFAILAPNQAKALRLIEGSGLGRLQRLEDRSHRGRICAGCRAAVRSTLLL